jgi:hypothetical protein
LSDTNDGFFFVDQMLGAANPARSDFNPTTPEALVADGWVVD